MTPYEADKIVAEYMNCRQKKINGSWHYQQIQTFKDTDHIKSTWEKYPYSQSLDALVPVWEKMELLNIQLEWFPDETLRAKIYQDKWEIGSTWQEAAAIATAKAIQKLSQPF